MSGGHRRIQTGIDGLDLLLDGGLRHPDGSSLLIFILGEPGTGKTHLALELTVRMLHASADSNPTHVYYGLDQRPAEIHAKLREDFEYYGLSGEWNRVSGGIHSDRYAALVHSIRADDSPSKHRHLLLASMREPPGEGLLEGETLFDRLDRDVEQLGTHSGIGDPLRPQLVTIDNVSPGQLTSGTASRQALARLRDGLRERRMHGIIVLEQPIEHFDRRQRAAFSAAEYAADIIVQLGFHRFGDQFKERSIEIAKARHQFYFRGTHHFSIVGRNEDQLRGARGQRPPGIHVYPSIPTQLSAMQYLEGTPSCPPEATERVGGVDVRSGTSNGLIAASTKVPELYYSTMDFLLPSEGETDSEEVGFLVSLQRPRSHLEEFAAHWFGDRASRLRIRSFDPEYLSSGKFLKDVHDDLIQLRTSGHEVRRVALCGISHLRWGFPLLHDAQSLLPWLQSFFRQQGMTSLFAELVPDLGVSDAWERESAVAGTVDNLFALDVHEPGEIELSLLRALYRPSPSATRSGRLTMR